MKNIDIYTVHRKAKEASRNKLVGTGLGPRCIVTRFELDDTVLQELEAIAIKIPLGTNNGDWNETVAPSHRQFFYVDGIGIKYTAIHKESDEKQKERIELQFTQSVNVMTYDSLCRMLRSYGFKRADTNLKKPLSNY